MMLRKGGPAMRLTEPAAAGTFNIGTVTIGDAANASGCPPR